MTFTFSALSTLFLLIKVIKNLSKVLLQQYNYPELIWIKQNVSFACSNYRSNWQLIDNFCLHLSEPNRIETRRKRIVNRTVTTEPRCTVISVNRCTSTSSRGGFTSISRECRDMSWLSSTSASPTIILSNEGDAVYVEIISVFVMHNRTVFYIAALGDSPLRSAAGTVLFP